MCQELYMIVLMNDFIEKYRRPHPLGFEHEAGDPHGWFEIPGPEHKILRTMSSPEGDDWRHVSVSVFDRCPTWGEMCFIRGLFFAPESVVVQFHPQKSEYVNNARYCLHLWEWMPGKFPTPPSILIGIK